jgi:hypothetical protein
MKHTHNALYLWHFTLSRDKSTDDPELIRKELAVLCKKYAFQLEDSSLEPEIPADGEFSEDEYSDDEYSDDEESHDDEDIYPSENDVSDEEFSDIDINDYNSDSSFLSDYESNSDSESSDDDGYIHWQGCFSLQKKRSLSALVKLVKSHDFMLAKAHFSPASNNSNGSFMYAMKIDTRISPKTYTDQDEAEIPMPRQLLHIKQLRSWQQEIMDRSQYNWHPRHINWLYDPTGNSGKSSLVLWCKVKRFMNCRMVPVMLNSSFLDLNAACLDQPIGQLYYIDLPRALPKKNLNEFMSFLETLKTGYVFDKRYQFRERVFSSPAIWVMSNVLPDKKMLSKDRLITWSIREDDELVLYPSLEKNMEKIKYPLTPEEKELIKFYFNLWRGETEDDENYSIDDFDNRVLNDEGETLDILDFDQIPVGDIGDGDFSGNLL